MRDLVLLIGLLIVAPLIIRAPIVGLLAWIWVTVLNPQREVYGFLNGVGLNLYIAVLTVLAWLGSKERKAVPPDAVSYGLIAFAAWTTLTTLIAFNPSVSLPVWDLTLKSLFLAVAVAVLANTRARIHAVVWALVISIGFYAIKGGAFVLVTGGRYHVLGADGSMIADNNAFGLALLLFLPLMNYLRRTSRLAVLRWALLVEMVLTVLAVLGTYSRGALIALTVVIGAYAIRSRFGVVVAVLCAVLAGGLPAVLPQAWHDRMATIQSADQDHSFNERLIAWKMNWNIALDRPIQGGGFYAGNTPWVAAQYSHGEVTFSRAAHSIFFEVLGDHGFVGFAIYFGVVAAAVWNTFAVLRLGRGREDLAWAADLARMLQICLVAFLVGGSALSMAYYDGALMLLALTAALRHAAARPAEAFAAAAPGVPRWKAAAAAGGAAVPLSQARAAASLTTTAGERRTRDDRSPPRWQRGP